MKVLLSGGAKTENILKAIQKKFESSGDEFIIEQYIDTIGDIFSRGEFFEKAIITEQSLTNEYAVTEENEIRQRINKFANDCVQRASHNESYIFLTQDEKMAAMISEEILKISDSSVVVVKKPPYSVQFFVTLITNNIRQLPENLVYKSEVVTSGMQDIAGMPTNQTDENNFHAMEAPDNMDALMTGGAVAGAMMNNGFGDNTDNGFNDNGFNDFDNNGFDDNNNFDNGGFDNNGFDNNGFNEQQQVEENNYNNEQLNDVGRDGFLPGFDEDNYTQNNDLYNDYVEDTSQNTMVDQSGFGTDTVGFSDDDYNNSGYDNFNAPNITENMGQTPNLSAPIQGFDDDAYSQPTNQPQGFDNGLYEQQNMQQPMQQQGFNQSDYDVQDAAALAMGALAGAAVMNQMNNRNNQNNGNNVNNGNNNGRQIPQSRPIRNTFGGKVSVNKAKDDLKPFAARGNSVVVTGCGGCGTSTIAFNMANILSLLGYSVLLVDMDTKGRAQNYISKLCYESMEPDGANLMAAVNSSTGINGQISVVKKGFHLLSMGIGADVAPVEELLHKEKLSRFTNLAKTNHNFVIYDIPFAEATNFLADITYTADNIALVMDASSWGVTKTMLSVCNIQSEDMQDIIFKRAQVVFNKYRNLGKVFGHKVRTAQDILKVMDKQVYELVGDDIGFYFANLNISGIINDDPNIENGWFEEVQYSDTRHGQAIFLDLAYNIIMNK